MHVDLLDPVLHGKLGHGLNLAIMAVDTARRQKAKDVQGFAAVTGLDRGGDQGRIFKERSIPNGLVDSCEVLIDESTRAEMQMPDLGIAHLIVRQTHGLTRAVQQGMRAGIPQGVPGWRIGRRDGVVFIGWVVTESVKNDQNNGFGARQVQRIISCLSGATGVGMSAGEQNTRLARKSWILAFFQLPVVQHSGTGCSADWRSEP